MACDSHLTRINKLLLPIILIKYIFKLIAYIINHVRYVYIYIIYVQCTNSVPILMVREYSFFFHIDIVLT